MRRCYTVIAAATCLLLMTIVRAPAVTLPTEVNSPDVVAVVLLDMTKISASDLKAVTKAIMGDAAEEFQDGLPEYDEKHKKFIAAGGQTIGYVMKQPASGAMEEPVALIKLSDASKADAMKALILELAPKGTEPVVGQLKDGWLQVTNKRNSPLVGGGDEAAGKTLAAALSLAGDAPIRIAVKPNEQLRAKIAQAQQNALPAVQQLLADLSAAEWTSGQIFLGDSPNVRLVIQSADDAGATSLSNSLNAAILQAQQQMAPLKAAMAKGMTVSPRMTMMVGPMLLLDGMKADAKGSQVAIALSTEKLKEVGTVIGPAIRNARAAAKATSSMSNMRQLSVAIQTYMADNDGAYPAKLDDLSKYVNGQEGLKALLTNPRTGEYPGYGYAQPPDPKTADATTVLLWELKGGKADPDGAKAYADGRVVRPAPKPADAGATK
ncbi:MAG: hypothetical protein IT444_09575 [Phycisphaeraceae bacterium]|nr:hypothetical protein [Phycisphaeraceae bacterium]